MAAGQILPQQEMIQHGWPVMASWGSASAQSCEGNTWSKRLAMDSKGSELWEVRAFAEDTNSCGAQWPPRSYSCSFCKRQFRTAQALGGHMNVHRRERALVNKLAVPRSATDYVTHCSLVSTGPNVGCNCKANAASPSVEYLSKPPSSSSSPLPPTTFSQTPGISAPKSMSQSTCVTGITNTGSRLSNFPTFTSFNLLRLM